MQSKMNLELINALKNRVININHIESVMNLDSVLNINAWDAHGGYLHYCFQKNFKALMLFADPFPFNIALLTLFKEKGAKFDLYDKNNETILDKFIFYLTKYADMLHCSNYRQEAIQIIRFLLQEMTCDFIEKSQKGYLYDLMNTPLAEDIDSDLITLFLKKGAVLKGAKEPNRGVGSTCLHALLLKAQKPNVSAVKFLLQQGLHPLRVDDYRNRCIDYATHKLEQQPALGLLFLLQGVSAENFNMNSREHRAPIHYFIRLLATKDAQDAQYLLKLLMRQIEMQTLNTSVKNNYRHLPLDEKNRFFTWLLVANSMKKTAQVTIPKVLQIHIMKHALEKLTLLSREDINHLMTTVMEQDKLNQISYK